MLKIDWFPFSNQITLQIFSHIWEKYFSYSEKLVVPNLWQSVYIYDTCIIF